MRVFVLTSWVFAVERTKWPSFVLTVRVFAVERTKWPSFVLTVREFAVERTKRGVFVLSVSSFGGRGESVGVEDSFQVVDLVLEDHCGESLHSVSNDLK